MPETISMSEELERSEISSRVASVTRRHSLNLSTASKIFRVSQLDMQRILGADSRLSMESLIKIDKEAHELDFWITRRRALLMESSAIARRYGLPPTDPEKGIVVLESSSLETSQLTVHRESDGSIDYTNHSPMEFGENC
jgi:hypothetical protein